MRRRAGVAEFNKGLHVWLAPLAHRGTSSPNV